MEGEDGDGECRPFFQEVLTQGQQERMRAGTGESEEVEEHSS